MKGKRAPLIAVLTQGGSKGRPLRKKRQEESRDPWKHQWASAQVSTLQETNTHRRTDTDLVVPASIR